MEEMKDVQNQQQSEIMSRAEAADYLRISIRKLDYLAEAGDLKFIKLGEGKRSRVLYRCRDLRDFLEANLVLGRAKANEVARRIIEK
jgi:excisionase family DNA binding protein